MMEQTLLRISYAVRDVIDASERVRLCANFLRKYEETEGNLTGMTEHDRLVRQLLAAEDNLYLECGRLK